jgi:nucleotide-binding universal stress UspA family protein
MALSIVLHGSRIMSYATLMVYVDTDRTPEERVRLAARLAGQFNAALVGLSAIATRPPVAVEGMVIAESTTAEIKEMRAKLADKGNWFRNIAGADHRHVEWRSALDFPTVALAREARIADLVVIGQQASSGDVYSSLDPGGVVLKVGRPTLVVPEGVSVMRADHIVIGWKDTREARRAVRDALPFFREATRISIVEICAPGEEGAAQQHMNDVVRYLNRHRIIGGPRIILHRDRSGAALLIRLAQEEGADLLVTGAYGHSRLGEWIFGGVTRELLATSPICCLMSH